MDIGPSSQRRETSRRRVWSPRAAKMGAEPFGSTMALELLCMDEVLLDQLHYHAPTVLVCLERLCPARERDLIEAGLGDGKHDPARHLLQSKDDERRRLDRIVDAALNRERMPPEGEQPLGFHLLDSELERHAFVFLLSLGNLGIDRRGYDYSAHAGAWRERAIEFHAEPAPELYGVGERTPDAFPRCAQKNAFLDAVCIHRQPPDCILAVSRMKCNRWVARPAGRLSVDPDTRTRILGTGAGAKGGERGPAAEVAGAPFRQKDESGAGASAGIGGRGGRRSRSFCCWAGVSWFLTRIISPICAVLTCFSRSISCEAWAIAAFSSTSGASRSVRS